VNAAPKTTVGVSEPTKVGRAAELASGGLYDPTGGLDTNPGAFPTVKSTKFGSLMRFLGPALQGGAIGALQGRAYPGGGFQAVQAFNDKQRAFAFQRMLMQREANNDAFRNELEAARTEHILKQPNFNGRGAGPIKGTTEDGRLVYMRPNPDTGVYEEIPGIVPEETPETFHGEMTDQGLVEMGNRGTVKRALLPAPGETGIPLSFGNQEPTEFDSGSPRLPGRGSVSPAASPGAIRGTGLPLYPPSHGKPKPGVVRRRNAAGFETDDLLDENPDSPTFGTVLKSNVASRAPLPNRSDDTRNAKAEDAGRSEQYAAAALAKNGNDPDKAIAYLNGLKIADPKAAKDFYRLLPQIRKSITDRTHRRVPAKKNPFGLSDQDFGAILDGDANQPGVEAQP